MATTQSARAAASYQAREEHGPVVIFQSITHTVAANPTANDILQLFKVPIKARILALSVAATDMDSSTGIAFEIGDGGDTDRYITAAGVGVSGQAGLMGRMDNPVGLNYQYTADDTIDLKWTAAASGTFTAGTVTVVLEYGLDV